MTTLKWLLILAVIAYGGLLALMYVFQRARQPLLLVDRRRHRPAGARLSRLWRLDRHPHRGWVDSRRARRLRLRTRARAGQAHRAVRRVAWHRRRGGAGL